MKRNEIHTTTDRIIKVIIIWWF